MKNWLKWIPNPNSWMSAILLNLLMGAFVFGIKCIQDPLGKFLRQNFSYRLLLTYQVLAILLPILAIAFTHHFLHLLLDRFFPETQTPDTARTEGLFPGILSWWEGLYGNKLPRSASICKLGRWLTDKTPKALCHVAIWPWIQI